MLVQSSPRCDILCVGVNGQNSWGGNCFWSTGSFFFYLVCVTQRRGFKGKQLMDCFRTFTAGQSRLRWKPPASSHRMPSCWSGCGSGTASHCCNLQINIYGPACSAGLSGSRPSGKIEEWASLCNRTTLPLSAQCCWAWRGELRTEMCLVLSQGGQNRNALCSLLVKIALGEWIPAPCLNAVKYWYYIQSREILHI